LGESLRDLLPPRLRLALAYAPARVAARWLGLMALDQRLAATVRTAREPMLAQIRLAWWRERLSDAPGNWPAGEPLFPLLASWGEDAGLLLPLVDGWEELIAPAPLPAGAFHPLAEARAAAMVAIARAQGKTADARQMAGDWALADLASRVSHPQEQAVLAEMLRERGWRSVRLPAVLRPLAVLHALAARDLRKGRVTATVSPGGLAVAMRVGLFGV
jgi:15-cis-phytoene synthase